MKNLDLYIAKILTKELRKLAYEIKPNSVVRDDQVAIEYERHETKKTDLLRLARMFEVYQEDFFLDEEAFKLLSYYFKELCI